MYTKYFQLTQRPFSRVPSVEGCVMFPGLKSSYDRCCEGIDEAAGPVLIIAASGCGKSTLLALIAERYREQLTTVSLNCATITSRHELIQCLLFELGLPFESGNVGDLRLKLIDHLKSTEHCPNGLLLLVDEGHNLSVEVLEELRMITNLVCGGQHQIRLVLAGSRPLEEKLGWPQLESFSQRISVRCYLQPMSRNETMFYALAQMQMCGRDGREIFQPSALDKIYDISDGVPRLAAQLCDHALKTACKQQQLSVDGPLVQRAWLDLQQLPEPAGLDLPNSESESGIVEFGSLDERPEFADTVLSEDVVESAADANATADSWDAEDQLDSPAELDAALASETREEAADDDEEPADAPDETTMDAKSTEITDDDQPVEDRVDNLLRELDEVDREAEQAVKTEDDEILESISDHTNLAAETHSPTLTEVLSGISPDHGANPDPAEAETESAPEASEVFGDAFENEEPVVDVQSSLLADQNRTSSMMTSNEVADLKPVESGAQDFEDVSIPQIEDTAGEVSEQIVDQFTATPPEMTRTDDSDMLVMGEPEPEPLADFDETESSSAPPQGQVIRMNYQDLFQQLRNTPPSTEA